jgi:hypothetical protein
MPHVEVRSRRVVLHFKSMQIRPDRKIYGNEMVDTLFKKKKRKINGSKISFECLAALKKKVLLLRKEWILTKWQS